MLIVSIERIKLMMLEHFPNSVINYKHYKLNSLEYNFRTVLTN